MVTFACGANLHGMNTEPEMNLETQNTADTTQSCGGKYHSFAEAVDAARGDASRIAGEAAPKIKDALKGAAYDLAYGAAFGACFAAAFAKEMAPSVLKDGLACGAKAGKEAAKKAKESFKSALDEPAIVPVTPEGPATA